MRSVQPVREAADPPAGKAFKFTEDRNPPSKPVTKPECQSSEKQLKFFEYRKPDKDIDRDRNRWPLSA